MPSRTIQERRPYRLIGDGNNHYAVIEARCGHVYSLRCDHPRKEAPDTVSGMDAIVGADWREYRRALRQFNFMVESYERYSQTLW